VYCGPFWALEDLAFFSAQEIPVYLIINYFSTPGSVKTLKEIRVLCFLLYFLHIPCKNSDLQAIKFYLLNLVMVLAGRVSQCPDFNRVSVLCSSGQFIPLAGSGRAGPSRAGPGHYPPLNPSFIKRIEDCFGFQNKN